MDAKDTCVWHGDCSVENSTGCPLGELTYDPLCNYEHMCDSYMAKSRLNTACPPHDPEEYILFQTRRYRCRRCGKELG